MLVHRLQRYYLGLRTYSHSRAKALSVVLRKFFLSFLTVPFAYVFIVIPVLCHNEKIIIFTAQRYTSTVCSGCDCGRSSVRPKVEFYQHN